MAEITLDNRMKKIKSRKQNHNKSLEQIKELALKEIEREKLKVNWVGLASNEIKTANNLYANYVNGYHIDSFTDLENLKTLVFNTILEDRIRKSMEPEFEDKDGNKLEYRIPNKFVLDSLTSMQKQNLDLKNKLGLNKTKKIGWMDFWQEFLEKINKHAVTHRGAFTFKCPNCGELKLLLRKVDDYNTFDWACFRSTDIYSETVMELIDEKKIDYTRAAEIFGCSPEYMDGIYNRVYLKEKEQNGKNKPLS